LTPIKTDELDVSSRPVFYGGVNVYLQQRSGFFRRAPKLVDRLLDSPVLLRGVGRFAAKTSVRELGALTVSVLRAERGAQRKELLKLTEGLRAIGPTLINVPNLMFIGVARYLKQALQVPVLCTLAGEDVFLDNLLEPFRKEAFDIIRADAPAIDGFIAPTRYYADHAAAHFGLDATRVHYVPMGVRVDGIRVPEVRPERPFTIGYLARLCPEKGLGELCNAFALLRESGRDCRLRIAGWLGAADAGFWKQTQAQLRARGLAGSYEYVGEVDLPGKLRFLCSLDVLSVPTVYREAKGLYVLEAKACGVPVVQPRHGAFPELIEATGGGRLYDHSGAQALADALAELMDDSELRARLAAAGRAGVLASFTEDIMAERTWDVYQRFHVQSVGEPAGETSGR